MLETGCLQGWHLSDPQCWLSHLEFSKPELAAEVYYVHVCLHSGFPSELRRFGSAEPASSGPMRMLWSSSPPCPPALAVSPRQLQASWGPQRLSSSPVPLLWHQWQTLFCWLFNAVLHFLAASPSVKAERIWRWPKPGEGGSKRHSEGGSQDLAGLGFPEKPQGWQL